MKKNSFENSVTSANFLKIKEGIYTGTIQNVYSGTSNTGTLYINYVVLTPNVESKSFMKVNVRYYFNASNVYNALNSLEILFKCFDINLEERLKHNNLVYVSKDLIGKPVFYNVSVVNNKNRTFKNTEFIPFEIQ